MIRVLVFIFVFVFPVYAQAQSVQNTKTDVVYYLLECSVFYETHGALNARNRRPVQDLWDKSDAFKTLGMEKALKAGDLSRQDVHKRIVYFRKKWNKKLLSDVRPLHKINTDIREWSRSCDSLGGNQGLLPLPR